MTIETQLRALGTHLDQTQDPITIDDLRHQPATSAINATDPQRDHVSADGTAPLRSEHHIDHEMEVAMLSPDHQPDSTRRRTWLALAAAATVLVLVAGLVLANRSGEDAPATQPATDSTTPDSTAQPTSGSVVMMTEWANPEADYSATGPFEVTQGADILGCASGTFVDLGIKQVGNFFNLDREWTCTGGDNAGTFTTTTSLDAWDLLDPARETSWTITAATGDFAGLQGEGEAAVDVDFGVLDNSSSDDSGSGVFTGTVRYDP